MLYEEKTIRSEKIYEGKIINLRIDQVELPQSKYGKREIVEHPGGVCVLPITEDGKMIMVKQFRKPIDDFLIEIPAGKLDKNDEDPLECAHRELREEIGYDAKRMEFLMSFYSSPGISNEKIYLYVARDLFLSFANPDEGEYIEIKEYTLTELLEMIDQGQIQDSKTIIGILAAKDLINKEK